MYYAHEYNQLYLRNLTSCVQVKQKIRDRERCTYMSRLIDYTSRLLAYTSRLLAYTFFFLVKTTRLDPFLVKTTRLGQSTSQPFYSNSYTSRSLFSKNYTSRPNYTRLDHYTSQSFLGKNYTSRSLFGKNYTSRSFFGQNYTSGSQPNSTQWTILRTSVSHNSLKSSPISIILIYMCSLHLGLKSCTICEKVWRLFYAAAFSRTKQFNTLSLFISQCDCTKQYQN